MKQSQLFTKTRKDTPKDEASKNAQLLIRAGYIFKEMAGVYTFLPLGWRVMNNIIKIIREEMNAIGGQELFMTALQNPSVWEKSGRWDDNVIDVWFKTKTAKGTDVGLGNTHEEALTNIMTSYIASHNDLPVYAYQFQTKFRNELRARSGIIRTREFIMKDLYSFSCSMEEHDAFYEKAKEAYMKIFNRSGIGAETFLTFASGGSFSKYSHEFQALCDSGEDTIYIDQKKKIAINKEAYNDEVIKDLDIKKEDLIEKRAIEVGNIFPLGTKFSDAFDLMYKGKDGKSNPVIMGSYGIGPGRLMGTIVELLADDRGLVWPESVAPFKVHLISLGKDKEAEKIYVDLQKNGIEVLFDDRDITAGNKFADADLIGIPYRVVISDKSLKAGGVEVKKRNSNKSEIIKIASLVKKLS